MQLRAKMNRLFKVLAMLFSNPVGLVKNIYSRIRKTPLKGKVNGVNFLFDFSYDPAMREMYCGTYENETVNALRKFLKKGDTFVDVGANIGYISSYALGLVGKSGKVYSFEPVPGYFMRLAAVAQDNNEYDLTINNIALGEKEGKAEISVTNVGNIGWNTMVPKLMSDETTKEKISVPVQRLDDYIFKNNIDNIALIKIDTEGFEFPVLKGLSEYFRKAKSKPAIICEIGPVAYKYLGYTLQQLKDYLTEHKYSAYALDGKNIVDVASLTETNCVLMIPEP